MWASIHYSFVTSSLTLEELNILNIHRTSSLYARGSKQNSPLFTRHIISRGSVQNSLFTHHILITHFRQTKHLTSDFHYSPVTYHHFRLHFRQTKHTGLYPAFYSNINLVVLEFFFLLKESLTGVIFLWNENEANGRPLLDRERCSQR